MLDKRLNPDRIGEKDSVIDGFEKTLLDEVLDAILTLALQRVNETNPPGENLKTYTDIVKSCAESEILSIQSRHKQAVFNRMMNTPEGRTVMTSMTPAETLQLFTTILK